MRKNEADNVVVVLTAKKGVNPSELEKVLALVDIKAFGSSKGVALEFYNSPDDIVKMRNRVANRRAKIKKAGGDPTSGIFDKATGSLIFRMPVKRTPKESNNE